MRNRIYHAGVQGFAHIALIVALFAATSLRAGAQSTASCSFENSPTECGFFEQSVPGGRASLTSTARDGAKGVRLHTEPGDKNIAGSGSNERDDLALSQSATGCAEGVEQWWAHSLYFPDDYVVPPAGSTWNWGVVFDFHHSGYTGQPNFEIVSIPSGLELWVAGGPTEVQGPGPGLTQTPIGPVIKNVWYDFVYHVKWSSLADGYFVATLNGNPVMNYVGPTLYVGEQCYLKLANYHTPIGQPVSVIHDRIKRAGTEEGLSASASFLFRGQIGEMADRAPVSSRAPGL